MGNNLVPDPYGCIRPLINSRQQTWCLMNRRDRGWQSSGIEYHSLAHLLAAQQIVLLKRQFDSYGIYWTIADPGKPNELPAVYLGRCHPQLWKGDLGQGVLPLGTQGTFRIDYTAGRHRCFTVAGQAPLRLTDADLVYLEPVLPP